MMPVSCLSIARSGICKMWEMPLYFWGERQLVFCHAVNIHMGFFSLTSGSIPDHRAAWLSFFMHPCTGRGQSGMKCIKCHLIFLLFFNSHTHASSLCLSVCTKCLYLQDNSCVNIRKSYWNSAKERRAGGESFLLLRSHLLDKTHNWAEHPWNCGG